MSRRAFDVLISMPEQHRFIRGMGSWIGFSQAPLLYDRDEGFAYNQLTFDFDVKLLALHGGVVSSLPGPP